MAALLPRYGGGAAPRRYRRASDPHLSVDRHTYTPPSSGPLQFQLEEERGAVDGRVDPLVLTPGRSSAAAIPEQREDPGTDLTQQERPLLHSPSQAELEQSREREEDPLGEEEGVCFSREELVALRLLFSLFDR